MIHWTKTIPFQVDIAGVIQIMGQSLYSRLDTPVRELIQNAHDGIQRRRQSDLSYSGRIEIQQDAEHRTLTVTDDGIGLTADEAERFLSTLGVGITGMLKGRFAGRADIEPTNAESATGDGSQLIGQFGIGLFSSFMLAERLVVETRKANASEGVRWEAGPATQIELSGIEREDIGTTVILHLKPEFAFFANQVEPLEQAVKEFADFVPIPIFVNGQAARSNVINVAWFDPTPDDEAIELALEEYFAETPLDVIPLRVSQPAAIQGALYVTPRRTPGFSGDATVAVTLRRMVISRHIQGLLPEWAGFLRGVLELPGCSPTASREDLVRDAQFDKVKQSLEQLLFEHFERLAERNSAKWQSIINWHRYTLAGAALSQPRLRQLLAKSYRFGTSLGPLTFEGIFAKSDADPLFDTEADQVLWYNPDRRQERWMNSLFANYSAPCVHTLLSFEESLLAAFIADHITAGQEVDLRIASPSAPHFAECILGIRDVEPAPATWQEFFDETEAKIFCADFQDDRQPVMAFLNERRALLKTFDDLKKEGTIPPGFQRLIDAELAGELEAANEVLLNRSHRLVSRALEQSTGTPLASVLRLLVINALTGAGAALDRSVHRRQSDDLDWIAEALWGKK
ncbi:MAG: ATP-binding protein [Planctomycetaceae bacterium]|nr:ATP-binding protein [Planctomycetaceae bacterium]